MEEITKNAMKINIKEDSKSSLIYDDALNNLNLYRKSKDKSLIKNIYNDDINEGDGVLIKNGDIFDIGQKENGNIKIIKSNINKIIEEYKKEQLELRKEQTESIDDPILKKATENMKNQNVYAPVIKKDWSRNK